MYCLICEELTVKYYVYFDQFHKHYFFTKDVELASQFCYSAALVHEDKLCYLGFRVFVRFINPHRQVLVTV